MKITLDPGAVATGRMITTLRELACNLAGLRDGGLSGARDPFHNKVNGVLAELAWAKWHDMLLDLTVPAQAHSTDFVMPDGSRVDIKAVSRYCDRLIAPIWKRPDSSDIYVLAVVRDNVVDFIGWARADELIREDTITDLGYGPTYVLPAERLHPFAQEVQPCP